MQIAVSLKEFVSREKAYTACSISIDTKKSYEKHYYLLNICYKSKFKTNK